MPLNSSEGIYTCKNTNSTSKTKKLVGRVGRFSFNTTNLFCILLSCSISIIEHNYKP